MLQRILVAWDGSELAVRALDMAIDIGRRYGAELTALSIARSPAHAETDEDRRETAAAAHRYLAESFAEVSDRASRAGVQANHATIEADEVSRAMLGYAHEHGFDLIVCGHHRGRRVGRLLLHGLAEELLGGATPVLVVTDDP
jgi:nucleotide-binding universal stress UspA family protein